jgi:hypothetical protein
VFLKSGSVEADFGEAFWVFTGKAGKHAVFGNAMAGKHALTNVSK